MQQTNPSEKPAIVRMPRIKDLRELGQYFEPPDECLDLEFGELFWIPDPETGLTKDRHPWVIVTPHQTTVSACFRTTSPQWRLGINGLFMPGGVVSELDKDGVFLLDIPQSFSAVNFRRYKYIGLLPEEWRRKLRAALDPRIRDVNTESSKP